VVSERDDAERLRRAGLTPRPDPSEGLFAEGCWLRRVSREPVLIFGGGRALLLEVAHPLVAAGVARHSNFRADPFGRLQRTLEAMSRIVFDERAAALAALRAVERAHAGVSGPLASDAGPFRAGTRYSGRDPELVLWVWATLLDTALAVYTRFVAELDAEALAAYYGDQRCLARLLGVPDALAPRDWGAFRAWYAGMLEGDVLSVTDEAREVAQAVLHPPAQLPGAGLVRGVTAGLLPPRLREAFGLHWDAKSAARLERLSASVRALRGARPDAA
jgi:uncharacterized protein (DUF2236 family)